MASKHGRMNCPSSLNRKQHKLQNQLGRLWWMLWPWKSKVPDLSASGLGFRPTPILWSMKMIKSLSCLWIWKSSEKTTAVSCYKLFFDTLLRGLPTVSPEVCAGRLQRFRLTLLRRMQNSNIAAEAELAAECLTFLPPGHQQPLVALPSGMTKGVCSFWFLFCWMHQGRIIPGRHWIATEEQVLKKSSLRILAI